jgi:small-conductance mechanosensitive channel
VNRFFRSVEIGWLRVSWLEAETARATRRLAIVLIWIFALTVAYPYIPGSQSDAFKGISVFVGLMISLGSAGFVNQLMSGLVIVYSRALKPGDFVQVGDSEGTITEVGMLSTKMVTPIRHEVTIPNAVLVGSKVTNFSRLADKDTGSVVPTEVTIGYDTSWRQVHAMLQIAAERTPSVRREPKPVVIQRALSDFYVAYQLLVSIDKPETRRAVLSELHASIQDVFNEYGVQIMSPNFENQPEGKGRNRGRAALVADVEQVAQVARLRAEVLRRGADLRAQVGGGVPGPARIIKDGPGQRDQVGVAGADDRLRLLEAGDQAHRNHRHGGCSLHRAGERHLVARPDRNPLVGTESAA